MKEGGEYSYGVVSKQLRSMIEAQRTGRRSTGQKQPQTCDAHPHQTVLCSQRGTEALQDYQNRKDHGYRRKAGLCIMDR